MASVHKHIRSGTANKRPTTAIAEGQIALATNITSPGLFFKDSTGATIVKIGPVHVGATAPNASPAGSAGNSIGEVWLDTSLTPVGVKIWNGSAFVNATPIGSTTVQGLLELATDAETQAGADTARAVTPASLQSKLSDSTSTTSNTTIASSTAVKAAYDLANAALPKTGGTVTGNLEIGTAGSLSFEGATADGFETTIAITDPTADRTITLPNTTGTVVTTGDTGTVTSTMLLDGTIVDADINANAEISVSKLVDGSARQLLQTDAAGTGVEWASNIDIPGTLDVTSAATFDSTVAVTGALTKSGSNVVTVGDTGTVTSTMILDGTILNADVNASAAIAGTKISPDFGSQATVTTGTNTAAGFIPTSSSIPSNGIYLPGANKVGVATNGTGRLFIDASGNVGVGTGSPSVKFHVDGARAIISDGTGTDIGLSVGTSSSSTGTNYGAIDLNGGAYAGIHLRTNNVIRGSLFQTSISTSLETNTAIPLIFTTNNTEAMRITSAGLVGIGTTSPDQTLSVGSGSADTRMSINGTGQYQLKFTNSGANGFWIGSPGANSLAFAQHDGTTRMTIDSSGRLGIGTTSPGSYNAGFNQLVVGSSGDQGVTIVSGTASSGTLAFADGTSGADAYRGYVQYQHGSTNALVFATDGSERFRCDSSGRLLVGTSTSRAVTAGNSGNWNPRLQVTKTGTDAANIAAYSFSTYAVDLGGGLGIGPDIVLARSNNDTEGTHTAIANNMLLGRITFNGSDGTAFQSGAFIAAASDGQTWASGDCPTRLVFSTTADGAASPTERMRISQAGNVGIGAATDPASLLHLAGGGTGTRGALRISDAGGANYWEIGRDNSTSGDFTINLIGSEKARIDTSGKLLVGVIASPAHQLQVSTDSAGKPSTNTWTIVSDERIKEEIELADLDLCYQAVKNIPLKRFKWKDEVYTEEQVRDRRKLGWIAQDVEAVFPKAVGTYEFKYNQVFEETIIPAIEEVLDDEGNVTTPAQPERIEKGELISEEVIEDCRDLNSDQLYAAMYGAIQKLMLKVETLETEVAALKAP